MDIEAFSALGFDFQGIDAVLDTSLIAQEVGAQYSTLGDILVDFNLYVGDLHCAGNDAHFTLRLLLILAVKNLVHFTDMWYLERLRAIAYAPIPRCHNYHHINPARVNRKRLGIGWP